MSNADEIFEKVRTTLVDALGVEDDEVTPEASLTRDLGGRIHRFSRHCFPSREDV